MTATLPTVPADDARRTLGLSPSQWRGTWRRVFTRLADDAGNRVVCREELREALQFMPADPKRARSAVGWLRQRMGRLERVRD